MTVATKNQRKQQKQTTLSFMKHLVWELRNLHLAVVLVMFGISKERPILGDHAKAHIFCLCSENNPINPRRNTWKVHEKHTKSAWKAYEKHRFSWRKTTCQLGKPALSSVIVSMWDNNAFEERASRHSRAPKRYVNWKDISKPKTPVNWYLQYERY